MFDSEREKEIFFSLCLDSAIISDVFLYWNVHHVEIHWEKNNYYVVLFRENSHTLFFVLCLDSGIGVSLYVYTNSMEVE